LVTRRGGTYNAARDQTLRRESIDEYAALVTDAPPAIRIARAQLLMKAQEVAYRFSRSVCGRPADAEDVMQDALMKTYRYVKRIHDPRAFRTWLLSHRSECVPDETAEKAGEPDRVLSLDEILPAVRRPRHRFRAGGTGPDA
jgi:hypothetical protein